MCVTCWMRRYHDKITLTAENCLDWNEPYMVHSPHFLSSKLLKMITTLECYLPFTYLNFNKKDAWIKDQGWFHHDGASPNWAASIRTSTMMFFTTFWLEEVARFHPDFFFWLLWSTQFANVLETTYESWKLPFWRNHWKFMQTFCICFEWAAVSRIAWGITLITMLTLVLWVQYNFLKMSNIFDYVVSLIC